MSVRDAYGKIEHASAGPQSRAVSEGAGDAIIASTSGAPTAYAGGDGCCVRDPDPQKGNGCSAGSETGGDAKPVCLFGKCDGHQNSGGGGGVALVGQSGDGADGVVVVRYQ